MATHPSTPKTLEELLAVNLSNCTVWFYPYRSAIVVDDDTRTEMRLGDELKKLERELIVAAGIDSINFSNHSVFGVHAEGSSKPFYIWFEDWNVFIGETCNKRSW